MIVSNQLDDGSYVKVAICGAPAPYAGEWAARPSSNVDLQVMGSCNRRVRVDGERCWQHSCVPDDELERG